MKISSISKKTLIISLIFFLAFQALADSTLNDTGITWSGLIPTGIDPKCGQSSASNDLHYAEQQDCSGGRDKKSGQEKHFETGFKYIKLDKNGKALPDDAKNWSCVQDKVSLLSWEVKQDQHTFLDPNDQYTWYNSNAKLNGGHIGDWNSRGNHCAGYEKGKPKTYCHTEQYISRVNKSALCGFNDWRLPTRSELASLVHFGRVKPTVETAFFPKTQNGFYWTTTPVAGREKEAWAINFVYGFSAPMPRSEARFVRLVRDTSTQEVK